MSILNPFTDDIPSSIFTILAEDQELITYRKSLNELTGGVTSTLLLQQIIYWTKKKPGQPFYKFREPCTHSLYQEGDSWTEELGFSPGEFDTAISRIGTKITKGMSKSEALEREEKTSLVIYWTDASRVTWYYLNVKLLDKLGKAIYLVKSKTKDTLIKAKRNLPLTETPTETPTDTLVNSSGENGNHADPLADLPTYDVGNSQVAQPDGFQKHFGYRQEILQIYNEETNLVPNQGRKAALAEYAARPGFNVGRFKTKLHEFNVSGGNPYDISAIIEFCEGIKTNGTGSSSNLTEAQRRRVDELNAELERGGSD